MRTHIDVLHEIQGGEAVPPPVATLIGFTLTEVEPGRAAVALEADRRHANPMGSVHGGNRCAIEDAGNGIAYAAPPLEATVYPHLALNIHCVRPVGTLWSSAHP